MKSNMTKSYKIDVTSSKFPKGYLDQYLDNKTVIANVNRAQLFWAAMTVGKPSKRHLFEHASYSFFEILNRCSLINMNIDFWDRDGRLKLSPLYYNLDSSEQKNVSYNLGMIFTKLFAHKYLQTPWLVHLSWMEKQKLIGYLSKHSYYGDLVGFSKNTHRWSVYEGKGRHSYYTPSKLKHAKQQASMNIEIDGSPRDLGVACGIFTKGKFDFHWFDPPPEGDREASFRTTKYTWLAYYKNVVDLYKLTNTSKYVILPDLIEGPIDKRFEDFPNIKLVVEPHILEFLEILKESDNDGDWRDFYWEKVFNYNPKNDDISVFKGHDGVTIISEGW